MELKLIFGLEIWACDFCFCTIRASFRDWIDREFIAHALNIYLCVQGTRFDCRKAAECHSSLTFRRQLRVWSFTLKNFSSLLLFAIEDLNGFRSFSCYYGRTEKRVSIYCIIGVMLTSSTNTLPCIVRCNFELLVFHLIIPGVAAPSTLSLEDPHST